jgi:hypothetical protein
VIVISGALVLVALVLLILGITVTDLNFVYASILVSLVSFVFLVIGIVQRRGDKSDAAPAGRDSASPASGGETSAAPVAAVAAPAGSRAGGPVADETPAHAGAQRDLARDEAPDDDDYYDDEEIDPADDRAVVVVPGRPRYHAVGCRYLIGKQSETIHLLDARDEGFTACGVCKPDNVVARDEEVAVVPAQEGVEAVVDLVYDDEPDEAAAWSEQDQPAAREAAGDRAAAAHPQPEPVGASSPRGRRAPASRGRTPVVDNPTPAAAAAAASVQTAPARAGRRAGTVVVIPDRGKYHRPECRYVRGAVGAEQRTKTQASKQGFTACGVCKP